MKLVKLIIINLIILVCLLELTSFLAIKYFHKGPIPNLYKFQLAPFFVDIDPTFGAWHLPDTSTRHVGNCWDVTYSFNSYGARDKERSKTSTKPRVLFLGDSFIEGYALEEHQRMSNIFEEQTGIEALNFGTSGIFGSTQMRLLYDTLASKFDHDAIVLTFFPFNDFWDDDYTFSKDFEYTKNRFRPYLIENEGSFTVKYHVDSLHKSDHYYKLVKTQSLRTQFSDIKIRVDGKWATIVELWKNFTYSGTLIPYLQIVIADQYKAKSNEKVESYFQKGYPGGLNRLFYNLSKIKEKAGNRPIYVIQIPHYSDMLAYKQSKKNVFKQEIDQFAKSKNIVWVDLLEAYDKDPNYTKNYLPCDSHWSEQGNINALNNFKEDLLAKLKE